MQQSDEVTLETIRRAAIRIAPHVIRTPLVTSERWNESTGLSMAFKCENLQHAGAFKSRGAVNAVFSLADEEADRGVVTHSSGNHAAALARAARLRGIPVRIVMPHNSRPNKIAAVRRYGVEPDFCEPDTPSRQAAADAIVQATGATLIHPYNDTRVISGQGTIGLELCEKADPTDAEPWDVVVVPVGGGGLLAGCLVSIKELSPTTRVVAAEPEWADDAYRSWRAGEIQQPTRYDTVADGLRTSLGDRTFPIIRELVDDILLAGEKQILAATRRLFDEAKLVIEPSSAVPLAAILQHPEQFMGKRVAVVLSGGNLECQEVESGALQVAG